MREVRVDEDLLASKEEMTREEVEEITVDKSKDQHSTYIKHTMNTRTEKSVAVNDRLPEESFLRTS